MSKLIFWNCRVLGSPEAILSLADLIRQYPPDVIFLCETKSWDSEMDCIKRKLIMDCGVWVAAEGRAGGLALLWLNQLILALGLWVRDILILRLSVIWVSAGGGLMCRGGRSRVISRGHGNC